MTTPLESSASSNPTSSGSSNDPKERFLAEAEAKRNAATSEQEVTLWEGGYSAKAMLGTWIAVFIASIALVVLTVLFQPPLLPIAIGVAIAMWLIVAAVYAYRRLAYRYELTTQRFIHQAGVLSRRTDRIEVIDIDDVSFYQGLVQRMLGIGTINITGSDRTHPLLTMRGIADVKKVAGLIDDTRRKERKKRSLHIQAM